MGVDILLVRPIRGAFDSLLKAPGYTATALLSVGGAIGMFFLMLVLRDWMSGAVFEIYVQWLVPDLVSLEILALAAAVAVITTLFAAQVAARRALRISPVEALRSE